MIALYVSASISASSKYSGPSTDTWELAATRKEEIQ